MPLYTYSCTDCLTIYEMIVKLKDYNRPIKCPKCDKELKKQMDAPSFKIN
jgi:putative FmdB family regulatory protein